MNDLERVRGMEVDGGAQPYVDTFDLVQPSDGESLLSSRNRARRVPWTKSGELWLMGRYETVRESDWVRDGFPVRSDNWVMVAPRSSPGFLACRFDEDQRC